MAPDPKRIHVSIVGAGIAGMTAALRLLEQGYSVTVFEESQEIGGKFGAVQGPHGIYHEHAYHIFPDWCVNFFGLCGELGLNRSTDFEAFPEFYTLRPLPQSADPAQRIKGRALGDFRPLKYLGSPEFFWANINSGVAEWQDMLLFSYSFLDLLTDQRLEREEFLNRVSVNGYVRSLPYASDMTALLHQDMLLKVFASPSYEVSARTYQTYLDFTAGAPYPHPPFRALKGNSQLLFWKRFADKLGTYEGTGQFKLERGHRLVQIEMKDTWVESLRFHGNVGAAQVGPDDHVIIAIPPERLYEVVQKSAALIKVIPQLLDLGQLRSVRFAALDLYFTTALTLPTAHVTLMDDPTKLLRRGSQEAKNGIASEYGLSLLDNGRFWPPDHWKKEDRGRHFLGVLVGDYGGLAGLDSTLSPDRLNLADNAPGRIIGDLQRYIRFTVDDIDWERSFFRSQANTPLFVNSVGSWEYRPETRLSEDDREGRTFERLESTTRNLHLAGDYCRSRIDVVSVEAALVTGITAARAICGDVPPALDPPTADQERLARARQLLSGWKEIAAARARAISSTTPQG